MRTIRGMAAALALLLWAAGALAQSLVISPATLPAATLGSPYNQTLTASGGTAPYSWSLGDIGPLPPGLSFASGVISGTPTQTGTYVIDVLVFDSLQAFGSQRYTLQVSDPPIFLSPTSLPNGTVGTAYSQTISASGGTGSFTFGVTSGALPSGLTLNASTGVLSGTSTAAATSSFTITATDSAENAGSQSYTVTMFNAVSLVPTTLPNGTVGAAYSQAISASGGTGAFTFGVTAGVLPGGLTLNSSTGVLSGNPTTPGTSNFTITATDAAQNSGSRAYAITVAQPMGALQVVSGDKQVVPANAGVPLDLVARVVDGQGNPVSGAAVSWVVVQGGGTISNATLSSDAQGMVKADYTTGPDAIDNLVRVTATGSGSSFTFTVRNQQKAVVEPARQLIAPQALLAITAPTTQLSNIRQHLDQLRLQRRPFVTERLQMSIDGRALPPMSAFALARPDRDGKPQKGGGASADKADPFERWGVFVNGDVNIGRQSTVDTQTGFKLRSKGITLGTDYRLPGNHVLGAAVGLMRADADLDSAAGSQDADGYSVSMFGSLVPVENAYIDAILNVGRNNYDSERFTSSASFGSETSGKQWGLALNAGYTYNRGPLALTPFGRVEFIDADVDPFIESGNPDEALAISEQRIKQTTLAIGGHLSYAISTSWGVLSPTARLELQRIAGSSGSDVDARIAADTISTPAQIRLLGQDKNFGTIAIGVTGIFARGFSGFLNYERQFGRDNFRDDRYGFGIRAEF